MKKLVYFLSSRFFLLTILFFFFLCVLQAQDLKEKEVEGIYSKLPTFGGLINGRYRSGTLDTNESDQGFDIRRVRFDVRGDLSTALDYRLQLEFAINPKILDAFFRWKLSQYFNLQTGQFKIPFTLENSYSPTNLETIENSTVISKLSGYSDETGIKANGRDIGLAAYGKFFPKNEYNLVDYYLGVFNGNGINNADNNKSKDFAGILTVNPIKNVLVAVSHYNGYYSSNNKVRLRTALGVKYDNKRLLVRGEYLTGKTDATKHEGFYMTTACYLTPKIQPVLKYDFYCPDVEKEKNQTRYIAGFNIYPAKNLRLQANYTYKVEKEKKDGNLIALQCLVSF